MAVNGVSPETTVGGINSITVLDYRSWLPIKSFTFPAEIMIPGDFDGVDIAGADHKFVAETMVVSGKADATMSFHQVDGLLFQIASGATLTVGSAAPSGVASAITNVKGTSIVATTGISPTAVLTSGKTGDLKPGLYIITATGTAALQVYATSIAGLGQGTQVTYADSLSLLSAPITITTSTEADFTNLGFGVTGGSGTIGFTIGDSAAVWVQPTNVANETISYGSKFTYIPYYAALVTAQMKTNLEWYMGFLPKIQFLGFNTTFKERAWTEPALKCKILRHETLDYSYQFVRVQAEIL